MQRIGGLPRSTFLQEAPGCMDQALVNGPTYNPVMTVARISPNTGIRKAPFRHDDPPSRHVWRGAQLSNESGGLTIGRVAQAKSPLLFTVCGACSFKAILCLERLAVPRSVPLALASGLRGVVVDHRVHKLGEDCRWVLLQFLRKRA